MLAYTDTSQPAGEVVRYYHPRYQIEFVIRDAKQPTGITHCQARSQEKLDFHLNMPVATVNLLRLLAHKSACSKRTYRRLNLHGLLTLPSIGVSHVNGWVAHANECHGSLQGIPDQRRQGRLACPELDSGSG
ncbi:hypothetical protein [Longimonas sp.]|uniref:hypothetical protein n=1 Tax=Longimonas sp. TaxID=2039626 RepID=UPI003976C0AD